MVLGLTTKNIRTLSVQVDYLIHVEEIKPWPPSQSLSSLRSVMIQWENGDRSSGSTKPVVPSIGSIVGEGRIKFNESFKLSVTLVREISAKAGNTDAFQKNCLELNLYEPRRDKTVKGQLLGTAIVDLSEYGIVRDKLRVNVPVNCKRNYRNTDQPILSMKIQRVNKDRTSSSVWESPTKEVSLDKNGGESVSALMNEEYAEEADFASFTDDDISSHSSLNVSSSVYESNRDLPPHNEEKGSDRMMNSTGENEQEVPPSKGLINTSIMMPRIVHQENVKGSSSCSSSVDLSSDLGSPAHGHASISESPNYSSISLMDNQIPDFVSFSLPSSTLETTEEERKTSVTGSEPRDSPQRAHEKVDNCISAVRGELQNYREDAKTTDDFYDSSTEDKNGKEHQENGRQNQNLEDEPNSNFLRGSPIRQEVSLESDTFSSSKSNIGINGTVLKSDQLKHVKSVRSPIEAGRSNFTSNRHEVKEVYAMGNAQNIIGRLNSSERKDAKIHLKDTRNSITDTKVQQLEHRIKTLEGELREAAVTEAALYSVVAEHGSSMSKVHAPARRLSRLYLYACKESCGGRKSSAARSAVSGLVLVAKACGNDVPRLTFWLSNSVVLRAIISQAMGDAESPLSDGADQDRNGGSGNGIRRISSPLRWKELSTIRKEGKNGTDGSSSNWDDPRVFIAALEKIEGWIFSRIVESIWWQTLTPHMQPAAAEAIDSVISSGSMKTYERTSSFVHQKQGSFSLELWKKAFKEAYERLCPLRGGGHECGCLPVLTRLLMEQCAARLDVAMFNAILRESADDTPTDPVSDPISDSKVLPIPAGITSFGAGAQLKVAIGNWSRWLTDLFGVEDDDPLENEKDHDDGQDSSFKSFHLLHALSELMMLPKDMLLCKSIRKEVCPAFGAQLIKRVIDNFVPDEFCPDPIPDVVLEVLDSEDHLESGEESVTSFPCTAAPTIYSPPSAAGILGEAGRYSKLRRSGSSVVRKSYTSDDELDELNFPLASIFIDGSQPSPPKKSNWVSKGNQNHNAIRYELLQEVWMNNDQ